MDPKFFKAKPSSTVSGSSIPFPLVVLNLTLRFLQFIFGIAVIGLYATDLNNARKHGIGSDSKWAYAVAVGSLSSFTALVYVVPKLKSYFAFAWDWILFILWAAVFGIFGKMYIHEHTEGNGGIKRMKNAVWIDLVNMLLWLVTAVMATVAFFSLKGGRSLHTGRAAV
ncbi:uncharacterized protein KY384_000621 [Bacidia gigantensis]|uniref:uncharacterized protein n=1 Tax=Bacidia gigantensis TaxID=2732470 RepID=UPI001D04B8B6|nr:uncharacterized protein KY384_000621 [Bacidia gigantensis]KAG8525861.1 hypothetical protein KY384_000621 [Bacidia gigantensis]